MLFKRVWKRPGSVRVALNHSPEAMQHSVLFGIHRGDAITRMKSGKRARLFDVIRPHRQVQTPDQTGAANCDRCRRVLAQTTVPTIKYSSVAFRVDSTGGGSGLLDQRCLAKLERSEPNTSATCAW